MRLCSTRVTAKIGVSIAILLSSFPAVAGAVPPLDIAGKLPDIRHPVVMIDRESRLDPAAFARQQGLTDEAFVARFGATGVVHCGEATGTGQLVASTSTLTTAAHVLFDHDGNARAGAEGCTFEIGLGSGRQILPINAPGALTGSKEPYGQPAIRDWAVARLLRPATGVRPYALSGGLSVPGDIVLYAAARSGGIAQRLIEACKAQRVTNSSPNGVREIAIDCDGEPGGSGAALLTPRGHFAGLYVGYRSAHPDVAGPYSPNHYNFGVTAEGAFLDAINAVAAGSAGLSARR